MIDIVTVRSVLSGHPLVRDIDKLPRGHYRIETELLYPDGSSIDLFVRGGQPLLEDIVLSDLGQTTGWLHDALSPVGSSDRRQAIFEQILRVHGVHLEGGAIEHRVQGVEELASGIVTLSQACLRTSDLWFVGSNRQTVKFRAQVGEVINESHVRYESQVQIQGIDGNPVQLDYRTFGRTRNTSILTLSSAYRSQSHIRACDIFARWHDLQVPTFDDQRLTIFDDAKGDYRPTDLTRLARVSILVPGSDRAKIQGLIAA